MKKHSFFTIIIAVLAVAVYLVFDTNKTTPEAPEFTGGAYTVINNNVPYFTEDEITDKAFEKYAPLDHLGRCGQCVASIGVQIMPTKDRESISSIKPSGWKSSKYDFIDGKSLYNRCHLIGFQLTGENANERNLITGTRYLNIEGMLPFENMVADYVTETHNHVMYRVTPVFEGNNLVASGVYLEGLSVEDDGRGICFNVYCFNRQPGVVIDYSDGTNAPEKAVTTITPLKSDTYILNTSSMKFHYPSCEGAEKIKPQNRGEAHKDRAELIDEGYVPCGACSP